MVSHSTRTDNLHDDAQATAVKDLETPPPPAMQSLGLAEDYVQVLNLCLLSLPDSVYPSVCLAVSLAPFAPADPPLALAVTLLRSSLSLRWHGLRDLSRCLLRVRVFKVVFGTVSRGH